MVKTKARLTEGPIFFRLFLFTVPIMLSSLLQVAYNMVDSIIVGQYSGDELALAAIGSTGALTSLLVNMLMGIATGAGVVIAQYYGARDYEGVSKSVHTTMTFSIISGIALGVFAAALSSPILTWMNTKDILFDRALLYFQIICIGIPATTVYNFGNASLRSVGDSRTPLYALILSSVIHVILSILFVAVWGLGIAGVAIATVISQYISAVLVVSVLALRRQESYALSLRKMAINGNILVRTLRYGLPTAVQTSLFSLSNVLITVAANELSAPVLSARTIGGQIDNLVYAMMDAYTYSTMTFVAQNYGAKEGGRIKKIMLFALIQVLIVGVGFGQIITALSPYLADLFMAADLANRAEVAEHTISLVSFFLSVYWMCGLMNTLSGILRGLGYPTAPTVIAITGVCGLRIIWIYFFYPMEIFHSLNGLYMCYPVTWVFCVPAMAIALIIIWKKVRLKLFDTEKKAEPEPIEEAA